MGQRHVLGGRLGELLISASPPTLCKYQKILAYQIGCSHLDKPVTLNSSNGNWYKYCINASEMIILLYRMRWRVSCQLYRTFINTNQCERRLIATSSFQVSFSFWLCFKCYDAMVDRKFEMTAVDACTVSLMPRLSIMSSAQHSLYGFTM